VLGVIRGVGAGLHNLLVGGKIDRRTRPYRPYNYDVVFFTDIVIFLVLSSTQPTYYGNL
jgi:hypothetical protein